MPALLAALLLLAAAPPAPVQEPGWPRELGDLWRASPPDELGALRALPPLSPEEVAARALDFRRRIERWPAPAPFDPAAGAEPLPPLPALSLEAHRERVQSTAAWTSASATTREPFEAELVRLLDAGAFVLRDGTGAELEVALYGVAPFAPEQYGGQAARQLAQAALEGGATVVPVSESSRRLYALVLAGDGREPLGERLLRHGLGWWKERYAALDERLATLQREVAAAGVGAFARDDLLSPGALAQARRAAREGHRFDGELVRATVVEVTDGDTLDVLFSAEILERTPALRSYIGQDERATLRLSGVDTPEIDQPGGVQAWVIAHLACRQEDVTLVLLGDGGHGRIAARVICADGELLGEKLVRMGRARHYEFYLPDERLELLERRARDAGVGIWADPRSVDPGVWRDLQIDVHRMWTFEGDRHTILVDADRDPLTTDDRRAVDSKTYRAEIAHQRFEDLCEAWEERVAGPAGRR